MLMSRKSIRSAKNALSKEDRKRRKQKYPEYSGGTMQPINWHDKKSSKDCNKQSNKSCNKKQEKNCEEQQVNGSDVQSVNDGSHPVNTKGGDKAKPPEGVDEFKVSPAIGHTKSSTPFFRQGADKCSVPLSALACILHLVKKSNI